MALNPPYFFFVFFGGGLSFLFSSLLLSFCFSLLCFHEKNNIQLFNYNVFLSSILCFFSGFLSSFVFQFVSLSFLFFCCFRLIK